jgi:hypothetical protein
MSCATIGLTDPWDLGGSAISSKLQLRRLYARNKTTGNLRWSHLSDRAGPFLRVLQKSGKAAGWSAMPAPMSAPVLLKCRGSLWYRSSRPRPLASGKPDQECRKDTCQPCFANPDARAFGADLLHKSPDRACSQPSPVSTRSLGSTSVRRACQIHAGS